MILRPPTEHEKRKHIVCILLGPPFPSMGKGQDRGCQGTDQIQSPLPLFFPVRDRVAMPFMVREPHHERDCLIVNSSIYPFATSINSVQALSSSKGSDLIATQSLKGRSWRAGGLLHNSAINPAPTPIFKVMIH
jgi:hypothetical protein